MNEEGIVEGIRACIAAAKHHGLPEPEWEDGWPVWRDIQIPKQEPVPLPGTWRIKVVEGRTPPNLAFPANDELMRETLRNKKGL